MNTLGFDPHRPDPRNEPALPGRPLASNSGEEPEIFDALADLFIGPPGDGEPARASQPRSPSQSPPQSPSQAPSQAHSQAEANAPKPAAGPGPVHAGPRAPTPHIPPLRLTGAPPPEPMSPAASVRAVKPVDPKPAPKPRPSKSETEALILGALPGRASSWSRQYAAGRVESAGRVVAFVRCGQGSVSVERCGSPSVGGAASGAGIHPSDTLAGVLDGLRSEGALVVVRAMDADADTLAIDPRLDRLTLLCGADDAAIVSAYRSIKQMLDGRSTAQPAGRVPALRVVVCGSDAPVLANARDRLADAIGRFAGPGVEVIAGPDRVKPVAATLTFDGGAFDETDDHESRTLDAILDRLASRGAVGADQPVTATSGPARPVSSQARPHAHAGKPLSQSVSKPVAASVAGPIAAPAAPSIARPVAKPELPRVAAAPTPAAVAAKSVPAPLGSVKAGASVRAEIAGLTELAARCPFAKGVSLRVDAAGGLHLVAFLGGALRGADADDAVASLAVAREWAAEHLDLIKLTPGATALASIAGEHLVTDEPKRVRRLLDGQRTVYVTAEVVVAGETRRVCVAIN